MTAVKYCSKLVAFLSCVSFFDFLCVVYIYIYIERNLWCHRVFRSSSLRWIAINDAVLATQSIGDIFFAVAGSSCVCVFFLLILLRWMVFNEMMPSFSLLTISVLSDSSWLVVTLRVDGLIWVRWQLNVLLIDVQLNGSASWNNLLKCRWFNQK